jgi:hypothetical protein
MPRVPSQTNFEGGEKRGQRVLQKHGLHAYILIHWCVCVKEAITRQPRPSQQQQQQRYSRAATRYASYVCDIFYDGARKRDETKNGKTKETSCESIPASSWGKQREHVHRELAVHKRGAQQRGQQHCHEPHVLWPVAVLRHSGFHVTQSSPRVSAPHIRHPMFVTATFELRSTEWYKDDGWRA